MAGKIVQKTFKVEFEVTVDMEAVGPANLQPDQNPAVFPHLQHLQQALLKDEVALTEQLLATVTASLQAYIDRMAAQDTETALMSLAASLEPKDRDFFKENSHNFLELTLPLRCSSVKAEIKNSQVSEKVDGEDPFWKPVWRDLFLDSELGQQLGKFSVPNHGLQPGAYLEADHFLLSRHLTKQSDGIHFEGRCSCNQVLEGWGKDEVQALGALWEIYLSHYESVNIADRLLRAWRGKRKKSFPGD